jgi:hypothetical protein
MVLHPAPQTFTAFAIFAKFANIDPAREHPTLIHRHAPRLGSSSERHLDATPPLLSPTGRVPAKWVAGRTVRASADLTRSEAAATIAFGSRID